MTPVNTGAGIGRETIMRRSIPRTGFRTAARAMLVVGAVTLGLGNPAAGDTVEAGWQAYQDGDFATAISVWSDLADAGNDRALFNLGVMYDEGRGVEQDRAKALDYWRRAADMGNPQAQHNLGLAHIAGLGR